MDEPTPAAPRGDPLLAVRPGSEHCRSCGGPWFGAVAYCPYCGRAFGSGPEAYAVDDPPGVPGDYAPTQPDAIAGDDASWTSWIRPLAGGVVLGVLLVVLGVLLLRVFGYSP